MFIRSKNLFLRPGWPEDQSELLRLMNDEPAGLNPFSMRNVTASETAALFCGQDRDQLLPQFLISSVEGDSAELIGVVALDRDAGDLDVIYWISSRHRGHGFGAEAVRAVRSIARALGHKSINGTHRLALRDRQGHLCNQNNPIGFAVPRPPPEISLGHRIAGPPFLNTLTFCEPSPATNARGPNCRGCRHNRSTQEA